MGIHIREMVLALPGLLMTVAAAAGELQGRLDWHERVALSMPVSGIISEVNAEVGATVEQGALLVKLDPRPFQLALRAARAKLKSTKLRRDEAERELTRAKELYERTLLSDHDLQLAGIAFETAVADYQRALAALRSAELEREYSELHAPFPARVLARKAVVGQTVAADLQPPVLFVLADARRMRVRVVVDAAQAAALKPGSTARVRVAGRTLSGRLAFVAPEPAEPGQGGEPRYEAVFEFATDGASLLRGQPATVELP